MCSNAVRREDVLERGAHCGERESVAGESAADSADVAIFEMNASGNAVSDFLRAAVCGAGDAAADRFAEDEEIGREMPCARATAWSGADCVGFVGDEQSAVTASEVLSGLPVPLVGEDDADVGHGGLGEDAGDVVVF